MQNHGVKLVKSDAITSQGALQERGGGGGGGRAGVRLSRFS